MQHSTANDDDGARTYTLQTHKHNISRLIQQKFQSYSRMGKQAIDQLISNLLLRIELEWYFQMTFCFFIIHSKIRSFIRIDRIFFLIVLKSMRRFIFDSFSQQFDSLLDLFSHGNSHTSKHCIPHWFTHSFIASIVIKIIIAFFCFYDLATTDWIFLRWCEETNQPPPRFEQLFKMWLKNHTI